MLTVNQYREVFVQYLKKFPINREPSNLYDPVSYILTLKGKRLRPILTLMATDIFSNSYKSGLDAALAVEVFHNFSLVHDDIMDSAELRRGNKTVHKKWNVSTGILSGDVMLIQAYQLFENYEGEVFVDLAKLFSKTAIEVCEGQQYDVDFETRDNVKTSDYLKMITYKTAVLLGASMKMGAIIARASKEDQDKIYDFGKYLGIAFQLQDDYLDAFGDEIKFGKKIGGDILENKKTYLYLKAIEFLSEDKKNQLLGLYTNNNSSEEKIKTTKALFEESGSVDYTVKEIKKYTNSAFEILESLNISAEKKKLLYEFGNSLMDRKI
ncbi:MAG: polyprenyl synthetase family protein [Flavobacteriaceae bacterium]|jgi:geranylgeranyl diphosphate synthase type II|nr:polyprenyl synthetase family protein [Flavobacteriaceae bacterium]